MNDRGVIEAARAADINVFALDEIEMYPEEKAFDVPGGVWPLRPQTSGFPRHIG